MRESGTFEVGLAFAVVLTALTVLTACGSGDEGGAPAPPSPPVVMPPDPDPATPSEVSATHLEMTDKVFVIREPGRFAARDQDSEGSPTYGHSRRDEVVCTAGSTACSFPSGAEGGRNILDGEAFPRLAATDASIGFHRTVLASATHTGTAAQGFRAFRVDVREAEPSLEAEVFGGWGRWSVYYAVWERDETGVLDLTWSAAYGELTRARPAASGSAVWRGAMVGRTRTGAVELVGTSRLTYDFAADSVDVALEDIAASSRAAAKGLTYGGPGRFVWQALPVAGNGAFGHLGSHNDRPGTDPDPGLGQVEGAFYGRQAQEAAGVFERDGVAGAFGAVRE